MKLQSARPTTASELPPAERSREANDLLERFRAVRQLSEQLCQPLATEDYGLQAMAATSPAKWHLAHTSWFFETFILSPFCPAYRPFDHRFEQLFNSYYNGVGEPYPRASRGLLSRPTVAQVYRYRSHVDAAMAELLQSSVAASEPAVAERTELGCHHEQQHQELFFTDLKYCWFQNPLYPAYAEEPPPPSAALAPLAWEAVEEGLYQVGAEPAAGFSFDNERPRHRQYVQAFEIADRPINNGEYLAFMADGGYQRADLWLADGWSELQQRTGAGRPPAPLYWLADGGEWLEYTLHGLRPLDPRRPACHLSAYEADAYARWAGARLPTEFEWEIATERSAGALPAAADPAGQFLDQAAVLPLAGTGASTADRVLGRVWQWTSSAYSPYPGYLSASGALGEYNGKFMANQLVLRGGSCVTSRDHYRNSYRNFFYPPDQWQFSGIRLARSTASP